LKSPLAPQLLAMTPASHHRSSVLGFGIQKGRIPGIRVKASELLPFTRLTKLISTVLLPLVVVMRVTDEDTGRKAGRPDEKNRSTPNLVKKGSWRFGV